MTTLEIALKGIMNSVETNFNLIQEKLEEIHECKQELSNEQSALLQWLDDGYSLQECIQAFELSFNDQASKFVSITLNDQINPYIDTDNMLSNQEDDTSIYNMKQEDIMLSDVTCICGAYLTDVKDASTIYSTGRAYCDICAKLAKSKQRFFHCPLKKKNKIHPSGYDVCDNCIKKQVEQQCCQDNCIIIDRFVCVMHGYRDIRDKDYASFFDIAWLSKINFEQLITDYSHLLLRHSNDLNFAQIVAKLGRCDIISCRMFTANNRNRAEETKSDELIKKEDEIYFQILDKMHCCFYHCYDIGYRLTPNEQEIICKLHDKSDEKK
eukprot:508315_1